jgi:hypothetical protein
MNQKRLITTALIQLSSTNKLQHKSVFWKQMLRRVGLLECKREEERGRERKREVITREWEKRDTMRRFVPVHLCVLLSV